MESYPQKHWDRVQNNYERNKKMGFPTVFIVPTEELEAELKKKLSDWKAIVVANSSKFEPGHPDMAAVDVAKTLSDRTEKSTEAKQADEKDRKQPEDSKQTQGQAIENQGETKEDQAPQSVADLKQEKPDGETHVEDEKQPAEKQDKAASFQVQITEQDKAEALLAQLKNLKGYELVTRESGGKRELIALKTVHGKTVEVKLGSSGEFAEAVKALSGKVEKPQATPQPTEEKQQQSVGAPSGKPYERPEEGKTESQQILTEGQTTSRGQQPERPIESNAESASQPNEAAIAEGEDEPEKTAANYREDLLQELAASGWRFTLKTCREKTFVYARKGRNENRSLGEFDDEAKRIIEKLKLKVNGFNE